MNMKYNIKKIVFTIILVLFAYTNVFAANNKDAIKETISTAFDTIKNVDIDKIKKEYYDENTKDYVDVIDSFFNDYPKSKEELKFILGEIDYEIKSIDGDMYSMTAKVDFSTPNFEKIIEKVMPKIIFKNAFSLFSKKMSEKNFASIIDCIYDELIDEKSNAVKYKKIDFSYEFKFKNENGIWVISNFDDIQKELMNIINFKKK